MRIAYLDCFSGISGDMMLGALIACGADIQAIRDGLDKLKLPGWSLSAATVLQNGITAVDVTVELRGDDNHHGRHLSDIEDIVNASDLPDSVKTKTMRVFHRLAEAEAKVHGTTPDHIHFHEVGAVDAIVDIAGSCIALDQLGVDEIHCAPLPMGHGFVECAHGTIPLPAPAVLELTQGVPTIGVDVEGELVTPTGAALATTLATEFGRMPAMTVGHTGYGSGKKRFGNRPNLLRIVIGDAVDDLFTGAPEVVALETNLDDFLPQHYETMMERLFQEGALDVYLAPIQMKKNRPATLLTVLSPPEKAENLAGVVFSETTTLGIRYKSMRRICLERYWTPVNTPFGAIRIKRGVWQGAETVASPEYEDVKAAAKAHGVPVKKVYQAAIAAYGQINQD